ncbi:anthranilate phosphoribosyltransferase [Patescibacteria group bacterium]|nr:anthranilate phosphoribosyltransferase [Patescibacteria group bacterium]
MLDEVINKLVSHQDLSHEEAFISFKEILKEEAKSDDIAAFLLNLQAKGFTPDEFAGCAQALKDEITPIKSLRQGIINISTLSISPTVSFNVDLATSFVVAGCGIPVLSNYQNPFHTKSKDVETLNALDIHLSLDPKQSERCINDIGIAFIDLKKFLKTHEKFENTLFNLKTETIFDLLSVIVSPASTKYFLIGATDSDNQETITKAFKSMNIKRAMIVKGEDNLDAITISDRTKISEYSKNDVSTYFISGEDFGIKTANRADLVGGSPQENAEIIKNILSNRGGDKINLVLLNAAAALMICDAAKDWKDGIKKAEQSIKHGRALSKFKNLQNWTRNIKKINES